MSTGSRRYLRWLTCSLENHVQKLCVHSILTCEWQGEKTSSTRCLPTKRLTSWQAELFIHSGDYWGQFRSESRGLLFSALTLFRKGTAVSKRCQEHEDWVPLTKALQLWRAGGWIILARLILFSQVQICKNILTCPTTEPDRLRQVGKVLCE